MGKITSGHVFALIHYVAALIDRNRRMGPAPYSLGVLPFRLQEARKVSHTRISLDLDNLIASVQRLERNCNGSTSLGQTTASPGLDELYFRVNNLRTKMVKQALPPVEIEDEPSLHQTEITLEMLHRLIGSMEDPSLAIGDPLALNYYVAFLSELSAIKNWALPTSIRFTAEFLWCWGMCIQQEAPVCECHTRMPASINPLSFTLPPSYNRPPPCTPYSSSSTTRSSTALSDGGKENKRTEELLLLVEKMETTFQEQKEEIQAQKKEIQEFHVLLRDLDQRRWRTKVRQLLKALNCTS